LAEPAELALDAVERAVACGAAEAEATFNVVERFSTEARDREVTTLEQSTGRALTLRVFVDGKKATLATSDLSLAGLNRFVQETVDAARHVAVDPFAGLPDSLAAPGDGSALATFSADVGERSSEAKIDDALALEALTRAYDPRIVNSAGSHVADAVATTTLANSKGFHGTYRSTQATRAAGPIAQDGAKKRVAQYGSAARGYGTLEAVDSIARTAAQRAVGMCGARKPATLRCPVIFERDIAAHVLSDIFGAINAANVAIGNSFLAGKIGCKVGSSLVNIVDDGRLTGGLGSAPFDAEGVPTRRTVVFRDGILETFLYDTYYGRKLGAASTGNASSGGVGPTNCYLQAGTQALEALVEATPLGVLVLDTIGFSHESVTGTYSRGARGFMIEKGELSYPIDEFTIAGNLVEMLANVDAVANDLRFDASIVSPSFRVAEMTVSGS
jgi:PmbA protein